MNQLSSTSNLFVDQQTANNCCSGMSSNYTWITFTNPVTCNKFVNECSFSMAGSILRWACENCDSNVCHHLIHTLCRGMFAARDDMNVNNRLTFLLLWPRSQIASMLQADAVPITYTSSQISNFCIRNCFNICWWMKTQTLTRVQQMHTQRTDVLDLVTRSTINLDQNFLIQYTADSDKLLDQCNDLWITNLKYNFTELIL